ncbi:MAG: hypothetical protein EOQ46_26035, partial [Mesorhizobium sp.]
GARGEGRRGAPRTLPSPFDAGWSGPAGAGAPLLLPSSRGAAGEREARERTEGVRPPEAKPKGGA